MNKPELNQHISATSAISKHYLDHRNSEFLCLPSPRQCLLLYLPPLHHLHPGKKKQVETISNSSKADKFRKHYGSLKKGQNSLTIRSASLSDSSSRSARKESAKVACNYPIKKSL